MTKNKDNKGGNVEKVLPSKENLIDPWVRKIDVQENKSLTSYINRVRAAESKSND